MSAGATLAAVVLQLPGGLRTSSMALLLLFVMLLAFFGAALYLMRRMARPSSASKPEDGAPAAPPSENEPAFMAASMQAVIQKLKEQERELERLHRQEKERAEQSARLTVAVTQNMPTGLLLVNASGLITLANPAAERVLSVGGLAYRRYSDVLGPESPLANLLADCLHNATTYQRGEVAHKTSAGDFRQLGVMLSPVAVETKPGEGAKTGGALCLLTDLTELTELQKQMRLKENLALLGELSAGIAHEFKNALATISGYAQMLRGEALTPEQTDSVERILSETKMLAHIVTEFLGFARPIELSFASVPLAALVERILDDVRQAHPSVGFVAEGEFGELEGDEALLRQALVNLVRNAAESAEQGAPQRGAAPRVWLQGAVESKGSSRTQKIHVLDNGLGIAEADLAKLFLPFHTTKSGGTGLGLAVVQKIMVHHGGTVAARNLAVGGAEFILTLPMRQAQPVKAVDSASGSI